jgi:hypothetical protein
MRCTRCCLRLKLSLNYWSLRPSLKLWSKNWSLASLLILKSRVWCAYWLSQS